jgi:hypothetical protein
VERSLSGFRSGWDRVGHVCVVEEALTNADNAQSLVDENCVVGNVVAAPIGAAVLDLLAHANGRRPELLHIGVPGGGQRVISGMVLGGGGYRTGGTRKYHTSCRCCAVCNGCSLVEESSIQKEIGRVIESPGWE